MLYLCHVFSMVNRCIMVRRKSYLCYARSVYWVLLILLGVSSVKMFINWCHWRMFKVRWNRFFLWYWQMIPLFSIFSHMEKVQSSIGFFKSSAVLKVSKFRNEFMMSSFLPKNKRFFRISALASRKKSDPKNKGTLYHWLGAI